MEAVAIALGVTAAKLVARIWTHDSPFDGAGDDVIGLIGGRLQNERDRRAVSRQFDELADNIADRLAPFLEVEARGIDEGELRAAAGAANETLRRGDATEWDALFRVDLSAARLVGVMKEADPEAIPRAGLGEAGVAVYDTLLSECASYITTVAHKLPGFESAQARELLSRGSRLAELAGTIMDGLPTSAVPNEWGIGSEDQRFENKFRRAVSEYSDRLQLFGVTAADAKTPYPLSVAYISLSVDDLSAANPRTHETRAKRRAAKPNPMEAPSTARVEDLLDSTDRLLLTGGAGSGKTTLIQWIALSSVSDADDLGAVESWQGRIPFIIPLRRFVGEDLPRPEHFIGLVAPNLVGAMPAGWVHRVLASGRATLLIDGLDEIPVGEREQARLWVIQLIRDFAESKVLITSRTTAITKGWESEATFRRAELLPMEPADIRSFIAHWHSAARAVSDAARRTSLDAVEASMLTIVRERAAIRSLCTSPLLCALICALHVQSGSSLPNSRMDVYKTALEMLILRRDNDRSVQVLKDDGLGYTERETLLRAFALWMHENGASDATYDDYEFNITQTLQRLYRVSNPAAGVATFLLERSGVLREPISGRVDFVHRTFLEYLAAAAIVDDNSIDKLIRVGHEDHWREVIILAAGHANAPQRSRLVNGLLDRGAADSQLKHRLYLLAVACMETSPDLPADIRGKLNGALAEVLPPTNMTEAAAVASAGSLAAPLLVAQSGRPATVAAACVRALSLIGGDEALAALATYGRDSRVTVTRQLIRAWPSFDTARYAIDVLAGSPLDNGRIALTEPEQLLHVDRLTSATRIFLDLPRRIKALSDLPPIPSGVFGADLSGMNIKTLHELPFEEGLTSLTLRNSPLTRLDGIEKFPRMHYLSVAGSRHLSDVSALNHLGHLSWLDLSDTRVEQLRLHTPGPPLRRVQLSSPTLLTSISGPQNVESLDIGYSPRLVDVSGLRESLAMRRLSLHGPSEEVRQLTLPSGLEELSLYSSGGQIEVLGAPNLKRLSLHWAVSASTFEWLLSLGSLMYFTVSAEDNNNLAGRSLLQAIEVLCRQVPAAHFTIFTRRTTPLEIEPQSGWSMEQRYGYLDFKRKSADRRRKSTRSK